MTRSMWSNSGFIFFAALATVTVSVTGATTNSPNLEMLSRVGGESNWVTRDGNSVAFGSEFTWQLSRSGTSIEKNGSSALRIVDAVLVRGVLYLNHGDSISYLDIASGESAALTFESKSNEPSLRVTRFNDHLLVFEQGVGMHVVTVFPPRAHRHHTYGFPHSPTVIGYLEFPAEVTALASSSRAAFLTTDAGELVSVTLVNPSLPIVTQRRPIPGSIDALAANGPQLLALGDDKLTIFDVRDSDLLHATVHDGVDGAALAISGRAVHVAGESGLTTFQRNGFQAETFFVTLTNFQFDPSALPIAVGDTVQWDNLLGLHDTDSCDIGEVACPVASTEVFDSGAPSSTNWTFSHTFILEGPNPYTCTVHAGVGMTATVSVTAASAPPPGVPDGDQTSSPLSISKLDGAGTNLQFEFDDATCTDAADTFIIGGLSAELPSAIGGDFSPSASRCGCGTTSPCTWNASPTPTAGDMYWFLMLASDGASSEGTWGTGSSGGERNGAGVGGASDQCGQTAKDLSNACGS